MSVDPDVARPLLAGFIAGAAVAFALTALLLVTLVRVPGWHEWVLRARLPAGPLGIAIVNALLLVCTLLGLVLGALYIPIEETFPADAPGTSNIVFSGIVGASLVLIPLAAWFVRGATSRVEWLATGIGVVAFAWALPFLAGIE